jgi:arylsulfatase A
MATQNNAAPSHQNPKNFVRNGTAVGPLEGYSAPLVVGEAVTWLKEKRDPNKPFYLQVWTHEPHLPIESDPQYMKLYPDLEPDVQQHHGNVTQLDAAFGRLMAALDELKLADNTLVIFTADNGPEGQGDKGRTRGSTGGLRGRKRDVYEGGVRVPFLVRWPGKTTAGTLQESPVVGSDIFHTALAAAGVTPPADRPYDGTSLIPLLRGEALTRPRPIFFHCAIAPGQFKFGLRSGDYKVLGNRALDQFELYNLKDDPREQTNLSEKEPARLEELKKQLVATVKEMEAEAPKWPKDNDDFAPPKKADGKKADAKKAEPKKTEPKKAA